jgi:Transposase domain (DUF772)
VKVRKQFPLKMFNRRIGLWRWGCGASCTLARPASHPFYERLNQLLGEHDFDRFVEGVCQQFYAATMGRPGLAPGIYFRLLLVGYCEGIDSERGIAWRAGDSLSIREFVGITLNEGAPDRFGTIACTLSTERPERSSSPVVGRMNR